MNAPILVTKEVAESLDIMLRIHHTKAATYKIIDEYREIGSHSRVIFNHFDGDMEQVFNALAYGYIVEKTPIERIQEYYNAPNTRHWEQSTIRTTLTIMGHKVEGVNA
jgi:hypothetical protein